MNDIKEAAERLRRQYPHGTEGYVAVYGRDGAGGNMDYQRDLGEVAMAYLAEHPADDGEAVTEEWLLGVGFIKSDSKTMLRLAASGGSPIMRHTAVSTCLVSGQWFANGLGCLSQKTRGDVRGLCKSLGIQMQTGKEVNRAISL